MWKREYVINIELSVHTNPNTTQNVFQFTTGNGYSIQNGDIGILVHPCGVDCEEPILEIWNGAIQGIMFNINENQKYIMYFSQSKHVNKVRNCGMPKTKLNYKF